MQALPAPRTTACVVQDGTFAKDSSFTKNTPRKATTLCANAIHTAARSSELQASLVCRRHVLELDGWLFDWLSRRSVIAGRPSKLGRNAFRRDAHVAFQTAGPCPLRILLRLRRSPYRRHFYSSGTMI